jgi:DNA topoisomerase-3
MGRKETTFNWSRGHLFDEVVVVVLYEHVLEFPDVRVTKVVNKETKKWYEYQFLPSWTVDNLYPGSHYP